MRQGVARERLKTGEGNVREGCEAVGAMKPGTAPVLVYQGAVSLSAEAS